MSPGSSVAILWAGAALAMTAGWAWQVRHENAGIVDLIWTGGIGAAERRTGPQIQAKAERA